MFILIEIKNIPLDIIGCNTLNPMEEDKSTAIYSFFMALIITFEEIDFGCNFRRFHYFFCSFEKSQHKIRTD